MIPFLRLVHAGLVVLLVLLSLPFYGSVAWAWQGEWSTIHHPLTEQQHAHQASGFSANFVDALNLSQEQKDYLAKVSARDPSGAYAVIGLGETLSQLSEADVANEIELAGGPLGPSVAALIRCNNAADGDCMDLLAMTVDVMKSRVDQLSSALKMLESGDARAPSGSGKIEIIDDAQINAEMPDLPEGYDWAKDPDGNVGILARDGSFVDNVDDISEIVYGGHANGTSTATNRVELPAGSRKLEPVGAQVNAPRGYDVYQSPNGKRYYQDAKGNTYASIDDLPTPTGRFSGKYEPNPKHDRPGGNVSPQPTNGESVLADSVPVGGNSRGRIGYDASTGEIVEFQNHLGNGYHGYATTWNQLDQSRKNALVRAGLFKPNGKPVK